MKIYCKEILTCFFIALLLLIVFSGCVQQNIVLGKDLSSNSSQQIKDIEADKDRYNGETVKIEGTIIEICPAGCWFNVSDGTGVLHINLSGKEFVMERGNLNRHVTVEGKIKYNDRGLSMIGNAIKVGD